MVEERRDIQETMQDTILRSKAVDDFLKAVYFLQKQLDEEPNASDPPPRNVPTNLIAHTLGLKAPTITDMVKRLAGIEDEPDKKRKQDSQIDKPTTPLLDYTPYYGVRLNAAGERRALEIIRHHRLIELYLVTALGYSWDEVHEEAERLEHHISEKLEARIAAALGNPVIDPHGDPIPALDGTIEQRDLMNLTDLSINQTSLVSQIVDQSPDVLRFLSDIGLTPGAEVGITQRSPLNDTVTISVGGMTHTISTQVARKVLVSAD